jgi:RNA polymerase sigma-70 factor, ECF subfamily
VSDDETHERARAARAAWPTVALDADEFAPFLATHAASAHAADLYLAYACVRGAAGAVAAFDAALLSQVPAFLARLRPSADFVEELRQLLREKLFTGAAPRIAEYSGRGPLGAWLRVVALRTAVDLQRARHPGRELALDAARVASGGDAELDYLKRRYGVEVKAAFQEALRTLSSEQRNLLRLHLVDELTLEEIATMFHVNRSTVLRRIERARGELYELARSALQARLGVSPAEFASLIALVRSRLDLSLAEVLGKDR